MRNCSIDTLKCLCAILIILLHVPSPYHDFILPVTRCAVPCFFMISGYFLYADDGRMHERIVKGIKKLSVILLWSTTVFGFVKILFAYRQHDWNILSFEMVADFLLFNQNPFGFHLWYITAYIYVLVVVWFIERYELWKIAFAVIPLLLLTDLMFGKYSLLLWGREFPFIWLRNWLFVGLPYFLLGAWIRKNWNSLKGIKSTLTITGGGLTSVISIIECNVLNGMHLNATRDHYISTTLLAVCVFLTALLLQQKEANVWSKIGERDSLYLYIFHPLLMILFATLSGKYLPQQGITEDIYGYLRPVLVFISTLVFIRLLRKIKLIS